MIKAVKTYPESGVVFLSCVSVQDISYESVKSCPMLVVVRHETWRAQVWDVRRQSKEEVGWCRVMSLYSVGDV